MSLLEGFEVVQIGKGLAAAICARLLADSGANVTCIEPDTSTHLAAYLNHGKTTATDERAARRALSTAALIVCEGRPQDVRVQRYDVDSLRRLNATATLVTISPFGQTGPRANDPASDLTLFFSSGIARLLTGQVDDLDEPPIRAVGEQSAFIGGLAAACVGMHATLAAEPGAPAADRWQRGHGLHIAGKRRICGDLAARGPAMGGMAFGDGLARLEQRSVLYDQARPRRQLGRTPRADVGV